MNERLDKEIDKIFGIYERDNNGRPFQNVSDWKETPNTMMSMNVAAIRGFAKHFYNLALDDVKKELKPEKDISYPDDYERGSVDGRNELREELLDFIDQLSK